MTPLDPNAKTISISYSGHNSIFCHDIVDAITNSFFDYDQEIRTQGADNSVVFIDNPEPEDEPVIGAKIIG